MAATAMSIVAKRVIQPLVWCRMGSAIECDAWVAQCARVRGGSVSTGSVKQARQRDANARGAWSVRRK